MISVAAPVKKHRLLHIWVLPSPPNTNLVLPPFWHGEGYTCDQYPRTIRLKPYSIANGYGWALLVIGGAYGEQIWCRTMFSDPCKGWLASGGGMCAEQQWYLGYVGEMHTPLRGCVRFVDATVPALHTAVDRAAATSSGAPLQDMIAQLGQQIDELHRNFAAKSDGEKRQMDDQLQSLLHAVEQRSQTTEQGMQSFAAQLEQMQAVTTERCESFEKHFMDSLARESSSIAAMQQEHLDNTNGRLNDMEKRALDLAEGNAHELRTMVVDSTAKVERLGADIQAQAAAQHEDNMAELKTSLGKAIDAIEQNMPAYIIETLRRFLQQRGLRLEDGGALQLTGGPPRAWEIEDGQEWLADEQQHDEGQPDEQGWAAKDAESEDEKARQPVRCREDTPRGHRSGRDKEGGSSQRAEHRDSSRSRRKDSRGTRPPRSDESRSRRGNGDRRGQRSRSDRRGSRRDDRRYEKPCTCPPPPPRRRSRSRRAHHHRAKNGARR